MPHPLNPGSDSRRHRLWVQGALAPCPVIGVCRLDAMRRLAVCCRVRDDYTLR